MQDLMSASCTFGSITRSASKLDTDIMVPEIAFTVPPFNHAAARPKIGQISGPQKVGGAATKPPKSTQPLSEIKATKWGTFSIQLKDATCIAIAKTRTKLITDKHNVVFSGPDFLASRLSSWQTLGYSCDQ